MVPTGFTEDKWVQRGGDSSVRSDGGASRGDLHLRAAGRSKWLADAKPGVPFVPTVPDAASSVSATPQGGGNDVLTIYTPGMVPDIWKPGQAKQIKAGSDLVFQMHYTANGKAGQGSDRIGLVFAKEPPTERIITTAARSTTALRFRPATAISRPKRPCRW